MRPRISTLVILIIVCYIIANDTIYYELENWKTYSAIQMSRNEGSEVFIDELKYTDLSNRFVKHSRGLNHSRISITKTCFSLQLLF